MALLEVVKYPDPRLRRETVRVTKFDEELGKLVQDMAETMYSVNGAGLAAIQVGDPRQLFIVEATIAGGTESDPPLVFINAELSDLEGSQSGDEGCLSFPGVFIEIERAMKCTAKALDLAGKELTITAEGLFARALQHEQDHLNGKLLIDFAGPLRKRQIKKYMDQRGWEKDPEEDEESAGQAL